MSCPVERSESRGMFSSSVLWNILCGGECPPDLCVEDSMKRGMFSSPVLSFGTSVSRGMYSTPVV